MIKKLDISEIVPNPEQPRKHFDEQALRELAESIKADGLQEPILIRPKDGKYEIVQGERRYRAHLIAGLTEIEAKIKEVGDDEAFHLAVIENIQREQLTPIEEARAFYKYIELGYTHEQISKKVNKSRTYVTSRLRLLKLIPDIQDWIAVGKISEGVAKQILKFESLADRLCGTHFSARFGGTSAFEELQYNFIKNFSTHSVITVKESETFYKRVRHLLVVSIVGRLNGNGDKVIDMDGFRRVRGVCLDWDLKPEGLLREDIHFMLEMMLEANGNDGEEPFKVSEIYRLHEKLEERWFDSGRKLRWSDDELALENAPLREIDLGRFYVFENDEEIVSPDT